jgi:hypothetical protein
MFDRLKGKVARISPAVKKIEPLPKHSQKFTLSEGRRKTLGMVADAILTQAVIDIDHGGIWQGTPDVQALEDEINRLYRLLTEGLTTLAVFKSMVNQWQGAGTQITKH